MMAGFAATEHHETDMAYHQARVLLLVESVANIPGTSQRLDGLTKLAKLDFLVRYPSLAGRVIEELSADSRLGVTDDDRLEAESPMIRYKYGPWDNRYYLIIGALVGKGLLAYDRRARTSVALRPTAAGKKLARDIRQDPAWRDIAMRCTAVAEKAGSLNGNRLKELIYEKLPEVMDRPHREVIRP